MSDIDRAALEERRRQYEVGRVRLLSGGSQEAATDEADGHDLAPDPLPGDRVSPGSRSARTLARAARLRARAAVRRSARFFTPERVRIYLNEARRFGRSILAHSHPEIMAPPTRPPSASHVDVLTFGDPLPESFVRVEPIDEAIAEQIVAFLRAHPEDSDAKLQKRMDAYGDLTGAVLSDLRSRVELLRTVRHGSESTGEHVLFDARSLQDPGFRDRGIGVFAKEMLDAVRDEVSSEHVVLFIDPFLPRLNDDLALDSEQIMTLTGADLARFRLFLEPSPMTADVAPLLPILTSTVPSAVVVYDFIPAEFQGIYLSNEASRLRYATQFQALAWYSRYFPISKSVQAQLEDLLPAAAGRSTVAWPSHLFDRASPLDDEARRDHVVVFGAEEPRKNTMAGLVGVQRASRSLADPLPIVVFGLGANEEFARSLISAAQLKDELVTVASHLPQEERDEILATARLVVVPSFAEGLSLPVIEAINAGTPVIASSIGAHEELLGRGRHLADPRNPWKWSEAVAYGLANPAKVRSDQVTAFARARPTKLAAAVSDALAAAVPRSIARTSDAPAARTDGRLSIGVATPWPSQRTGVADYSLETIRALAQIADVTLYVTSSVERDPNWTMRSMSEAETHFDDHDVFLSIIGNSHFHIPMLDLVRRRGGVVLAHDSKMVEFYASRNGHRPVDNLMNCDVRGPRTQHSFAAGVEDNAYGNMAFGEIAAVASSIIVHSSASADRISEETGVPVLVVPFVPLRRPDDGVTLHQRREEERSALGFAGDTVQIATIGIVDLRTKLHDVVLESAQWLRLWGHDIALTFIGGEGIGVGTIENLTRRSGTVEGEWFKMTGHVTEEELDSYLDAVDVLVQLRTGNVSMLSAPVADAAAFGVTTLASNLLVEGNELPEFVETIEGAVSPLLLAERLEELLQARRSDDELEALSSRYRAERNSAVYADALLKILERTR